MTTPFDPDAAASGGGIYGLPFTTDDAHVIVIPVPYEATTSSTICWLRSGKLTAP